MMIMEQQPAPTAVGDQPLPRRRRLGQQQQPPGAVPGLPALSGLGAQPGYTPTPKPTSGNSGSVAGNPNIGVGNPGMGRPNFDIGSGNPGMGRPNAMGQGAAGAPTDIADRINVRTAPGAQPNAFTQFGPDQNLISTQVNPVNSRATNQAQSLTNRAATTYAGAGTPSAATNRAGALAGNAFETYAGSGGVPTLTNPAVESIAPGDYTQARNTLSSLAGGGSAPGGAGGFGFSGDTTGARGMATKQLDAVMNTTPDRAKLAGDALSLLEEQSAPGHELAMRKLGQRAGALGRVGSGMTTNDLTGLQQSREQALAQERRRLASEAAGLTLDDARSKLGAATDVASLFGGQDAQAGGLNLGYAQENARQAETGYSQRRNSALDLADLESRARGEAVDERNFRYGAGQDANDLALGLDDRRFDRGRSIATDLGGWLESREGADNTRFNQSGQQFRDFGDFLGQREDQDFRGREEVRGERGYQNEMDQTAIDRAVQERMMMEQLLNGRFGRGMDMIDSGYSGSPTGTMLAGAANAGNRANRYSAQAEAGYGAAGDAIGSLGYNRRRREPAS